MERDVALTSQGTILIHFTVAAALCICSDCYIGRYQATRMIVQTTNGREPAPFETQAGPQQSAGTLARSIWYHYDLVR